MKTRLLQIFILFFSLTSFAQQATRSFVGFKEKQNYVEVLVSDGKYRITPYTNYSIETTFIPTGEVYNPNSHAIVLRPQKKEMLIVATDKTIEILTDGISVSIQKSPFQLNYLYKNKALISEKSGYIKTDSTEILEFTISKDEVLYGGGARALGMNRRGNRLQLYNRAHYGYETHAPLLNYTMPLVLSSKIYALHFDNAPIGFLDLDSKNNNTIRYETISGRKTYQVIAADSWLELIDKYTDLTGKQPMIPRWALGNFSSRFGYHSQQQTKKTVQKFIDEKIPLDAIIIDIYWFGKDIKGHMGNLEFLKDSFPNPQKMITDFTNKGIKTILVTEPFVLTTSKRWKEASENHYLATDSIGNTYTYDFYFGNTGLIDIYKPKAQQWFWNIYKKYTHMGIAGWWGDLGEPEVHPSNLIHTIGTADEVHNIYGHDWAKLIFKGYQKDFPNKRPFILMRAGYSGSQQFGMIPWSGDVNRSWGGLQSQPEIALQMGMQGMAFMHSDLGGFAGNNPDNELYTRWLQYGVFQPIYRPHAQEEMPPEPVFREATTKALVKKAIELRYQLLPYNYTLAYENNQTGAPLMRPLFFEEPHHKELLLSATSYLWGNDFLITPILQPKVTKKEIYFPKKSVWFDFYTDKRYKGGQTDSVTVQKENIPTFVRAGAFIPMAKTLTNTNDYHAENILLHYYYDTSVLSSKGKLYNDNGITANTLAKKEYELLFFYSEHKKKKLHLEFERMVGTNYKLTPKNIKFTIHNIQKKPKRIKIAGKRIPIHWNKTHKTVSIPIVWKPIKMLKIDIKL